MRGLFGAISLHGAAPVCLRAMLGPLVDVRGSEHVEIEDGSHGSWALGRVHLGVLQPARQLPGSGSLRVLVHGDLSGSQLPDGRVNGASVALVSTAYETDPASVHRTVRGAFVAAVVDTTRRTVQLVSDAIGSYPLYWTIARGTLLFAPSVRAVLRGIGVPAEIDRIAVADYLHFGFVLGTRTLDARVRLLGPGSRLSWNWGDAEAREDRVEHTARWFGGWSGLRSDYLEATRSAFNDAVRRAATIDAPLAMSLSGGLDSRAILSALPPGPVTTYTVGVRRCADDDIARRLAALGRTRHMFAELGDKDLRDFVPNLERVVALSDGFYLSHGLTEMAALEAVRSAGTRMLLRGHCGELAKASLAWPLHTDERVFGMRSAGEAEAYLAGRVNYVTHGDIAGAVFTDSWARDMDGAAAASLHASLDGLDLQPADVCSYLYLHEHHRRFTVPSLELFRHETEVRLPFADEGFLRVLLQAPPEWRDGTDIHRHITGINNRRMLAVRNSNTGAPGNAAPWIERLLDPVNSVLKRLNAPGFRHYHSYAVWMRAELTSSVERVLLAEESLDRGMLRREGLARAIQETRAGTVDHGYLLQILLTLELWQRQVLSDQPRSDRSSQ
jgi:asparagine synthase (glutamine-hydrolysing)